MILSFCCRRDVLFWTFVSGLMVWGSVAHWLPMELTEVFGFITGALSVYLTVRENIWLWPTGIANNVFFGLLFWRSRLYADMALQVVYVVLSVLGWYWWLYGGAEKTELPVAKTRALHFLVVALLTAGFTAVEWRYLIRIQDSSPFCDGLTTALSLAAQYLLTRKFIENWYLWILADLIYIPLFCFKHLYLTAALNAIFLTLCFAGLASWRRSYQSDRAHALDGAPAITLEGGTV